MSLDNSAELLPGEIVEVRRSGFKARQCGYGTASEFRYRKPLICQSDCLIAISQSGETADTLEAIKMAKEHKALTIGVVNVVGSSIARETDAGMYLHAGPEIGVASTKAFTCQVIALLLMALRLGKQRGVLSEEMPCTESCS
eukprot:Skav230352  [mRNA]  locus=scaffold1251:51060:55006:- [translate_table: standard]